MVDKYGTEVATSVETLEGEWSINGESYKLVTKDTKKATLDLIGEYMQIAASVDGLEEGDEIPEEVETQAENLANFEWETEDDEKDMVESVVSEKLIKPDVDVNQIPQRKLRALFEGMMDAWNEGTVVKNAKEEMPIEGNRSASRIEQTKH